MFSTFWTLHSWLLLLLLVPGIWSRPVQDAAVFREADRRAAADSELPRLVIYFQTTHDSNGDPISMLPLVDEKGIALTHLIVCSLHVGADSIVLNDYSPYDSHFYTLWNETEVLQKAGIKVMGMVGGAASGSFTNSTLDGDDAAFEKSYGQLHDVVAKYSLQGMDIDVEQDMSQAGIERLVKRLRSDFGADFQVTLAPVAAALGTVTADDGNLSGFNYAQLEQSDGSDIAFYNAQFYNGWGSMATPDDFEGIVADGWAATKVLMGQITSAANGNDFVPYTDLNATVIALRDKYGDLGGIMGWEYFNSEPGGTSEPWEWAQKMTEILRPGQALKLAVSKADVQRLNAAWRESSSQPAKQSSPSVNYAAMLSA